MPKPKSSKPTKAVIASSSETASVPTATTLVPEWPSFKPTLPVLDLAPELHPATSKIILVPSFFPRNLCRDYVSFLKTLPLQATPAKPKRGEAVRVNDRFQVNDEMFATRLWEKTGLKEVLLENEDVKDLWEVSMSGFNGKMQSLPLACQGFSSA